MIIRFFVLFGIIAAAGLIELAKFDRIVAVFVAVPFVACFAASAVFLYKRFRRGNGSASDHH